MYSRLSFWINKNLFFSFSFFMVQVGNLGLGPSLSDVVTAAAWRVVSSITASQEQTLFGQQQQWSREGLSPGVGRHSLGCGLSGSSSSYQANECIPVHNYVIEFTILYINYCFY